MAASPRERGSSTAAPAAAVQMAPRCDLPEPAGPASTTTAAGQSGQRSTRATALALAAETTRSSRVRPAA